MTLRTLPFGPAVAVSLRPLADPVLSERPLWPHGNPAVLYLASLGSASARRTMRSAVGNLAGLLGCDSFEAAPWPLLRYAHVVALRAALVSLRFAPATVNRHLAALRGVVRQAWRLGYIAPDDYQRMSDIPGVRGTRLLTGRALSYPELEALFAACADGTPAGHRDAALVALLFSAGLRRAEASSLLLADIDVDSWTIRVLGKGNHEREVPLRGGGRDALERWLIERGRTPGPLLCRVPLGGYVLPDCGLSPEGLRRRLIYRARRAGHTTLHAARSPSDVRYPPVGSRYRSGCCRPHGRSPPGPDDDALRPSQCPGGGSGRRAPRHPVSRGGFTSRDSLRPSLMLLRSPTLRLRTHEGYLCGLPSTFTGTFRPFWGS